MFSKAAVASTDSRSGRMKFISALVLCLSIIGISLATIPIRRAASLAPAKALRARTLAAANSLPVITTAVSESACVPPGITVVTDPTGDELPAGTSQDDIQKIAIAEPNQGAGENKLLFTLKVADLNGTLPANTQWKVYFTGPDAVNYWVDMATDGNSVVGYNYGTAANSLDTTIGFPDSGSYSTNGTITIGIANAKVGNPVAGQTLTLVNAVVYELVGVVLVDLDDTTSGSYTLIGNSWCAGGPSPTPTPAGSPTPTPTPTPTPIPNAPQYLNYYPPAGVAESFGEPSIGADWKTGKVMFFGGFSPYALRVGFDDSTTPATVTWDQTALRLAATPRVFGDPILFADRETGRTFVSQLIGLTPFSGMDYTDDDGANYLPTQGSGIGAGVDHQTVGGGPFHAPVPAGLPYPHSVYYCAQEGINSSGNGIANCAVSFDGGLTFGPSVPIYALSYNGCFPLHGHIKVGPDGTAYVPNRGCSGKAGMVVSEDNGITWNVSTIPNSSAGSSDPSIGIATDGTVFLGYQGADGHPRIAVTHDHGQTWINHTDVGAPYGINSGIFPAVVAGDGGIDTARAAFAFYGSSTSGDQDSASFKGAWYLYISSTFDGGKTWVTVNATPGDPMQRDGICTRGFQGCTVPRNLLDFFDATVDQEGRVIVGYEDGCMGSCVQGGSNSNTEKGVIARQSAGQRMFAAFDPNPSPTPTPTATPTPTPTPTSILPAPQDPGPRVGFQNYEAPGTLVSVNTSSQGPSAKTVEYLGHDAGEPSIGNNWKTGVTNYQSDLQTLFVTFNDNCPAAGEPVTWVNRPAPTSVAVDSDPIGFTDRATGRTFAAELTLTSPTCKTSYTDDDGQTWTPTQGSSIGASIDHESVGGGPFHAPLTRPTNVPGLYPDAVYYCSQIPQSACARSDDGGLTFGPVVPVDPVADAHCGGLHGHLKVAPDGTVYLPFNFCDGQGATIVSLDNGITWTIQHVTGTTSGQSDPAVGIDDNGRAYFAISSTTSDGSQAVVATTDNGGQTWQNIYDVGAAYGLKNIAYPTAVAADAGRAAVAFYGTTTAGNYSANGFPGIWHLYIAETFDGGLHWTTTDATPNAPMQRGCIWTGGGANICRNLLDFFDMTVDSQGRVEVGYVNGCAGGNCAQAASTATGNAYTATAVIARQSSGRRLVAAFDPPNAMNATTAPGIVSVTTLRVGSVVHLGWSEGDTGNSDIQTYRILRGTASGSETSLTTVPGNHTGFDDTTATDATKTYYYKVLAVNAVGVSCSANEVAAPYLGDTCSGLILQRMDPTHPESILAQQNPSLAIDYVAAGEPPATDNLMFRMKVGSLASVPANSRWRIVWNSETAPGQQWFVGMRSDANSNVTFEYGNIATAVVGLVIGVPTETMRGNITGNFSADGTITMFIPKTSVGNPQPGDLLGAVNGRTFTGDTSQTNTLERSTLLIDHTFVKAQRDNGSPAATYTVVGNTTCSPFIEQNVNSLVSLQASNPGSAAGVSSFNLTIKNTSTQTIFVPLRIEVAQLTSASGKVTVKNADSGGTGVGAMWDYSNYVGTDNILSAGEVSSPRTLKFNNPNSEAFTITFNVIGNLANPGSSPSSSSSSSPGGSVGSSSATVPTAVLTSKVFQLTYNPLLNTLTVQLK
jgi:hypothetical protein